MIAEQPLTLRSRGGRPGPDLLREIVAVAGAAHAPEIARDAEILAQRLGEGRFYVACLGQFKRGKSTLLNALVGAPLLPTGVAPVTSVATVIRYGARRAARVRMGQSRWMEIEPEGLSDYVTEERNPGNRKGVQGIEVFAPTPILRDGLCLVDTPGLGSVFPANTAATREFLPQVDAGLVVLGADPPITADELGMVEELAGRIPHRLFVLAKADRMSDLERREALAFTRRVLGERSRADPGPIFEVSAAEVLATGSPSREWEGLREALRDLAERAGASLVAGAEERGTSSLAERLVATIDEQVAVLERPLAESEARMEALRKGIGAAERAMRDLAPLFAAEEARLLRALENERDTFFREAGPLAETELEAALRLVPDHGPALRARALEEALAVARRWLGQWQERKSAEVEAIFRSGMARFVELLAAVQLSLRQASTSRGTSPVPLESGLLGRSHFYMTELLAVAPTSLGRRVLDVVGAASERRSRIIREQAAEYLRRLLEVNSARSKNDFRERLATSRRELEAEVRRHLREGTATAERQLDRARKLHARGDRQVAAERQLLNDLLGRARDIRDSRHR